ncbi:MAG: hypothetical protein PHD51_02260 [Patescibacteria group bacterium]|nr:hypothetical protein [Patescibacteria group bacterium]MDD5490315.1 hypothetical protein [Patescibacteria group bacterium]
MPSPRISKELKNKIHFLTFTVKRWYYLFDRYDRWNILLNSLQYCQNNKSLKIYAWVFMLNHIHLIAENSDLAGFTRDFKTFTSKELKKNLSETEPRVLELFKENDTYQFWQPKNWPELIENEKFYLQKVNYIEQNPVRKQYVKRPEDWIWSSANPENLLELADKRN